MDFQARIQSDDLFLNLAEQVKLPFVQIAHAAELLENPSRVGQSRQEILVASRAALQLIDGYLLSVELQRESQLHLEPVSLSSVMYDAAECLQDFAGLHDSEIQLHINGKYAPVMAHRRALRAALITLGLGFIEAGANDSGQKPVIKLAVRRLGSGINAGVYADTQGLSNNLLRQARAMQGRSRQPMAGFSSGNGSGIFIADSLFSQLHSVMKTSRLQGFNGLAATLVPSKQLSLV